ncbi:MAG: ribbon-helix-helix protein, CopG family [Clostridia bacterium]|nr:ribbon-helix-helix protein, CopG family [Clostridia bacterium]
MLEPKEKLIITKKGEDGYKTFSVRIREDIIAKLEDIAKRTNRSRNDLISMFIEYAMEHCEIHE